MRREGGGSGCIGVRQREQEEGMRKRRVERGWTYPSHGLINLLFVTVHLCERSDLGQVNTLPIA